MTKLGWGLWVATTLVAILALISSFGAHDKVNKAREDLGEVWKNNEMLIESLQQTFEENAIPYELHWLHK